MAGNVRFSANTVYLDISSSDESDGSSDDDLFTRKRLEDYVKLALKESEFF